MTYQSWPSDFAARWSRRAIRLAATMVPSSQRRAWLDEKEASRQIRTTVAYDNLTKRYSLTREIDGEIDAIELVDHPDAMRHFMTTFESLLLFDVSSMEANEEYYLRVNGVMRVKNVLLLIPWDVGADWREAHFTYIP